MGQESSQMMPIWLDEDGGLKTETVEKIQELSNEENSVLAQHPHWKGAFTLDDMAQEDLEAISTACFENDEKLGALFDRLVPGVISQTTFWTSYLSHVEYYLMLEDQGQDENGDPGPTNLASPRRSLQAAKGGSIVPQPGRSEQSRESTNGSKVQDPVVVEDARERKANNAPNPANNGSSSAAKANGASANPTTASSSSSSSTLLTRGVVATAAAMNAPNDSSGSTGAGAGYMARMVDSLINSRFKTKESKFAYNMKGNKVRSPLPSTLPAKSGAPSIEMRVFCPEEALSGWVSVWRAGVHVRAAPSIEAPSIGSITYGEAVLALQRNKNWIRHRFGWSCTQIGNFTLLQQIPRVSTPYGNGFLCHRDSSGRCKVLLATFGAEAYLRQNHVQVKGDVKHCPAWDVSRLVHMAKSDATSKLVEDEEGEEVKHTGLVVGLLQAVGVMDED